MSDLMNECWHDTNDAEMCYRIRASKMPLSLEDARLVARLFDQVESNPSIYDLHRLNLLCHQAIGYMKAMEEILDLKAEVARLKMSLVMGLNNIERYAKQHIAELTAENDRLRSLTSTDS